VILTYLALVVIFGQAIFWLWHRENTAQLDDKVWRACVSPGE
jgi:hypothetical protein